jgi:hypothetical protein
MRKTVIVILVLILSEVALAKNKKDPTQYPLSAHVVSINTTVGDHASVSTSSYNYQTNQWTYGNGNVSGSSDATVQFQIGNLIYTGGYGCRKKVQVGTDVHARLEKNKKLFILTDDGQTCETHVRGIREVLKETK